MDEGVITLSRGILVFFSHEVADGTEENGKGCMKGKMMRANECGLDVGGFVFVFHFIECCADGFFQCLFVIGYKDVIKSQFFLKDGSASSLPFVLARAAFMICFSSASSVT